MKTNKTTTDKMKSEEISLWARRIKDAKTQERAEELLAECMTPTPTLTAEMIEALRKEYEQNQILKHKESHERSYVNSLHFRNGIAKARVFMQSGEAPQEYRFLTYEDDNILERLDSCLAQIEMPSDVNNQYETVRELISNRLSKTTQESKGDGIDLTNEQKD